MLDGRWFWAQTPFSFCVVGWSDASWACRREGSSQGGHVVGITNTGFLDQAECKVSVISWHSGRLARVARSSTAAELQAAADAEGELTYIRLPFWEIFGGAAPLKKWKDVAGQVPATLVLDSRGAYDVLERSGSSCLGLEDKRSGLEALALKRSTVKTPCTLRWTHSAAQPADCMTRGSEETQKPFELLKRRNWRWVCEPSFTSVRKRAQKVHGVLDYLLSTLDETLDSRGLHSWPCQAHRRMSKLRFCSTTVMVCLHAKLLSSLMYTFADIWSTIPDVVCTT